MRWTVLVLLAAATAAVAQNKPKCETCEDQKKVTCVTCEGQWKNYKGLVVCVRKNGVGCDGVGWVKCFDCKGAGFLICAKCNGSGTISSYRSTGGAFQKLEQSQCPTCAGRGKIDCKKCTTISVCPDCLTVYQESFEICRKCADLLASQKAPRELAPRLETRQNVAKCPRCKGSGHVENKGKCPNCDQGKTPCPDCAPQKKPKKP